MANFSNTENQKFSVPTSDEDNSIMSLNELQPFYVSLTRMSVQESPGKCRVPTCIRQKGIYSTFITKGKSAIRKYVIKLSYESL